jgi:hypothetical protein
LQQIGHFSHLDRARRLGCGPKAGGADRLAWFAYYYWASTPGLWKEKSAIRPLRSIILKRTGFRRFLVFFFQIRGATAQY